MLHCGSVTDELDIFQLMAVIGGEGEESRGVRL